MPDEPTTPTGLRLVRPYLGGGSALAASDAVAIEREAAIAERARIAEALRRYFEDGPGTFRALTDYLDLDYSTAYVEGWMDFNNAIVRHDERMEKGEPGRRIAR